MVSKAAGSVFKRGSRWWVKVELPRVGNKRQYHRKGGFATRKEAEAYRVKVLAEIQRGCFVEPAKLTLREYAARWLEAVKPNLAPRSWEAYEMNLRVRILPRLGNVEVSKLHPLALQELYTKLLAQGLSPRSVLYVHRTLHRMLEMAVKWGLVGRNVADAVEPPKQERREVQVLDEEQAAMLLDGITDLRLLVPVALALGCGMRRSEICGLRWQDVDLEAGRLHITQTVQRLPRQGLVTLPTKTHRSRRPVDIPPDVVGILRRWRKQQFAERLAAGPVWQDTGFVCTTPDGRPLDPDWLSDVFPRTVRALGLPPITFHALRHTHATLLLKRGTHPRVVQERLGHSSINITMDTYSHVLPGMQKEAALAVNDIFARARSRGQV